MIALLVITIITTMISIAGGQVEAEGEAEAPEPRGPQRGAIIVCACM